MNCAEVEAAFRRLAGNTGVSIAAYREFACHCGAYGREQARLLEAVIGKQALRRNRWLPFRRKTLLQLAGIGR
jgi:hypothetical protein